jgi:hypothetical protein
VSCSSACAYAILGATQRLISPSAALGVHSGYSYLKWASPGATQRQRAEAIENGQRRTEREIQRYLAEMGINKELFAVVKQTKFETLHLLTRAELFSLGIDRRELADSGWQFTELPASSIGSAAVTTLVARDQASVAEFRRFVLTISCGPARSGNYTVSMIEMLPNVAATPSKSDIRIRNDQLEVWMRASGARTRGSNDKAYDVRQSKWPVSLVEKLLHGTPLIAFVDQPLRVEANAQPVASTPIGPAPIERALSGAGVDASLQTLSERCEQKP